MKDQHGPAGGGRGSVPVERVRLGTETVTETETVSGQVRKEQIELDDPTNTTTR